MGKAFAAAFPKRQTAAFVCLAAQACGTIGDEGEAFEFAFLQSGINRRLETRVQFGKRVLIAPHVGEHARRF